MTTRTDKQSKFAGIGGHHSPKSATTEWLTPPGVIERLGGWLSFDLDPCGQAEPPYPIARRRYCKADNGLAQRWHGRVFVNPPYDAQDVGKWMGRLADHGTGTALIFARTETSSFMRYVWKRATALLFIAGRINFHVGEAFDDELTGKRFEVGDRAPRNSGAPLVLIAYGHADADVLASIVDDADGAGDVPDWPRGKVPGVFLDLEKCIRPATSGQLELLKE
jgi:hypothetical protein